MIGGFSLGEDGIRSTSAEMMDGPFQPLCMWPMWLGPASNDCPKFVQGPYDSGVSVLSGPTYVATSMQL